MNAYVPGSRFDIEPVPLFPGMTLSISNNTSISDKSAVPSSRRLKSS